MVITAACGLGHVTGSVALGLLSVLVPLVQGVSEGWPAIHMFTTFENGQLHAKLDEYSEVNIEFHQTIIRMSGNSVLISLAENLFTHMRMIRRKTIGEEDRADRSIRDHMNIIEALDARVEPLHQGGEEFDLLRRLACQTHLRHI